MMARGLYLCSFLLTTALLGINAWPNKVARKRSRSGDSSEGGSECVQQQLGGCILPVMLDYYGLKNDEALLKIMNRPLSETCSPLLAARDCMRTSLADECNVDIDNLPGEAGQMAGMAQYTLNYICVDNIDVFDRNKRCLIGKSHEIQTTIGNECPYTPTGRCPPSQLLRCANDKVRAACNDEIADHLNTLSSNLFRQIGCDTFRLFRRDIDLQQAVQETISEALDTIDDIANRA